MSWSGRSLRARIEALRESSRWQDPEGTTSPRTWGELARSFRRGSRDDAAPAQASWGEPSAEQSRGAGSARDPWGVGDRPVDVDDASSVTLVREGALWVWEEWIDPATAAPDHFAPDFALDLYDGPESSVPARSGTIYFDLETTGLASHDQLFMSGLLWWEGDRLRLRQEIAEDIADERALVERARQRLQQCATIVTYNGRSFDLPALDRRLAFHGFPKLDRDAFAVHDLLHLARRLYKGTLPNCKLSTLEREIIAKERSGEDVPGLEVPLRFLDFVETGDPRHLAPVLYHNRIDLTTMVALFPRLRGTTGVGDETAEGV
ncbi:MAG: ribonuclease H-like domain-containing protein [Planctomycetes bacterium]|nr:ribonuclease H-like domain-containing protein [Planctomycetota bacterium]